MTQRSPYPRDQIVGRTFPVDIPGGAPPLYGVDTAFINIVKIPLDDVRSDVRFEFGAANFIWALDATSLTAELSIKFNSQRNSAVPFKKGMSIGPIDFAEVFVSNLAQTGESITFFTVRTAPQFMQFINPSASFSEVSLTKPSVLDTVADVSCANAAATSVLGSFATKRSAMFQNKDGAATVQIGDNNVSATRGINLGPGDVITIDTTESVFVRNDSGAAVDIGVMWTAD
ncbi:hypothetical protein LCGC14_0838010 [marine sediment metagenome]|uniref:Uncharacterized protein n=1 Tax=marine sediment metagenome TaxID=412755 RepID=A0A0F9SL85_9ZZZZ